jgi:signal transduction histidine kinase
VVITGSDRALRLLAFATVPVTVALSAATPAVGAGIATLPGVHPPVYEPLQLLAGVVWCPAALLVIMARPRNPIGWVLLAVPLLGAVQNFSGAYGTHAFARPQDGLPGGAFAISLGSALWTTALFLPLTVMLLRYPSGRLPQPRWRWADRAAVTGMVAAGVGLATAQDSVDDWITTARPVVTLPGSTAEILAAAGGVLLLATSVAVLGNAVLRTARAHGPERAQLLLLVLTGTVTVGAALSPWNELFSISLFLVPIAVAVGVLRYNLLGIEVVVRRTLLYGTLTLLVAGVYAAVVALVSLAIPTGPTPAVVAAALVAVGLLPVRQRLQWVVDFIVYGGRRDPVAAVTMLGAELPDDDALPTVVGAVARSLRSPYVAVTTPDGTVRASTAHQPPVDSCTRVALRQGETHLGDLVVAPRDGSRLDAADRRLLDALAVQVAAVVRAVDLAEDLAVANRRTLAAATSERDRLRRDLHDGLGPSLTGIGLGLEATETAVADGDEARAAALVQRLRIEVVHAVDGIRRILDDLRPSALDRVGLAAALQDRAAVLTDRSGGRLTVAVEVPEDLPPLDPDIETAAYRIVEEAVTNALRHSGASHVVVRVVAGPDRLELDVCDDGHGLPPVPRQGVGLESMQRRAESLGGSLGVSCHPGVRVVAALPMVVSS